MRIIGKTKKTSTWSASIPHPDDPQRRFKEKRTFHRPVYEGWFRVTGHSVRGGGGAFIMESREGDRVSLSLEAFETFLSSGALNVEDGTWFYGLFVRRSNRWGVAPLLGDDGPYEEEWEEGVDQEYIDDLLDKWESLVPSTQYP